MPCCEHVQDDEKLPRFEEQLRNQMADELEAFKRENFELSVVECKARVEDMFVAASAEMAKVSPLKQFALTVPYFVCFRRTEQAWCVNEHGVPMVCRSTHVCLCVFIGLVLITRAHWTVHGEPPTCVVN